MSEPPTSLPDNRADALPESAEAVVIGAGHNSLVCAGYLARAFGWPTGFVGPLTGGVVGALVSLLYQARTKRSA